MYSCDCCGRYIVPAKLKGIGYYCDDCLDSYVRSEFEIVSEDERHYPVCPHAGLPPPACPCGYVTECGIWCGDGTICDRLADDGLRHKPAPGD